MANINRYLPTFLQEIIEFQLLNQSLDVELENIDKNISNIENEVIIKKATILGIDKWEKSLNIIPLDSDSLEIRRFRISNILKNKLPYTELWLKNKLKEITNSEDGFVIKIDYDNHIVAIIVAGLDANIMSEVQKQLRGSIPANMELEIGGEAVTTQSLKYGIASYMVHKYKFQS